ncbi:type VI secretion system contractile sheath small subunit [uncultured Bartonella sp.]|uniref:type VI secretion system contractile sheath small subunit n=1 Tax=uncultured Bartonella sp. TaxID=104108 RepID=UPI00261744B4|nr:type VI secretion system contractile sheath small subunit [uncultured Bartonella sp.]
MNYINNIFSNNLKILFLLFFSKKYIKYFIHTYDNISLIELEKTMTKGSREGAVAPKERINIKYIPATGGQQEEKELPLRMMFVGDFTGRDDPTLIEERKVLSVDKNTFSSVMEEQNISLNLTVQNTLTGNTDDELKAKLKISSLDDFSPDSVAKQIPETRKLLELRDVFNALKGPLGNIPSFRHAIQSIIEDPSLRDEIVKELAAYEKAEKTN